MTKIAAQPSPDLRFRTLALAALLAVFTWRCFDVVIHAWRTEAVAGDFACLWAGARTAFAAPTHIYDFEHVTGLQAGWTVPGRLRPFVYPPSALLAFLPLAALGPWGAYAVAMSITGAFFLWASRRAGAPWWLALFPSIWLVAAYGQTTFAVAGLVLLALTLRDRPILAGVLFGLAAALKPQALVLLPIGLVAARQWRSLAAAAATGVALLAISSAVWGPHIWLDWLTALARFQHEVLPATPGLRADEITVFAGLELLGLPGALAYLLAPVSLWLVWTAFRKESGPLACGAALFGGALLISPYAMNYDSALLAPGVAALMARRNDPRWLLYATVATIFTVSLFHSPAPVLTGLAPAILAVASAAATRPSPSKAEVPSAA
jgi:hypothetical protein